METPPFQPPVRGDLVGGYRVVAPLGGGGYGCWRGRWRRHWPRPGRTEVGTVSVEVLATADGGPGHVHPHAEPRPTHPLGTATRSKSGMCSRMYSRIRLMSAASICLARSRLTPYLSPMSWSVSGSSEISRFSKM